MAWKWYGVTDYKASVGGPNFYGILQLMGEGFYASLRFRTEGPLPDATAGMYQDSSGAPSQYFNGYMEFRQMPVLVDLLRNEEPVNFGFWEQNPNEFHVMTGSEPVGEGDGMLVEGP